MNSRNLHIAVLLFLIFLIRNANAQDHGDGRHFVAGAGLGYAGGFLSLPITGGEPGGLFWGSLAAGFVSGGVYEAVNKWGHRSDENGNKIPHGNASVRDWAFTYLGGLATGVILDTWIGPKIDEDYTPIILRPFSKKRRFYKAQRNKMR